MIRVGQKVQGWEITYIGYPVGEETWTLPPGWVIVSLTAPDKEFIILTLSPQDQNLERISLLLREELEARSRCVGKTITL